jgi:hypothetical protein
MAEENATGSLTLEARVNGDTVEVGCRQMKLLLGVANHLTLAFGDGEPRGCGRTAS